MDLPLDIPLDVPLLEIRLLGGFSVKVDGKAVTAFRSSKSRALLAYLATQPDQDHPRTLLATLLWGDLPDTAAKTNLRIELSNLKKLLEAHPALEISHHAVRFHSALSKSDVHQYSQAMIHFSALPVAAQAENLRPLSLACDLYQGEFLAGIQLYDVIEFDDWRLSTQERLHEQMMVALATLQTRAIEQGRWSEVAGAARRQLTLVPWTEAAHRNLMQSLAAEGQIQAALEQFTKCRKILQEELGVEPSLPTLELAERLREGRSAGPTLKHNLYSQLKSLVGRKEEVAHLHGLLQRERFVTLLGIGGVGKSLLAQAVALYAAHDFADGVWFAPLANIEPSEVAPERIALAIAAATGCPVTDMHAPLAEVASFLANKQLLLVLDNCEHLTAAAEVLFDALLNHTSIHILATSRVRLMVDGEIPVHLTGLPTEDAFSLFVERARRLVPSFAKTVDDGENRHEVNQICQRVAGLPLGIELAASWVEHYSVAEIGQSLAEVAIEPRQAVGMESRHHTLSSVFEYSWRLLSPREQRILARLSVFRGGFDRAVTATVAESGLSELSVLIGHSLVQRLAAGRYELHPLIQEFASSKLVGEEIALLYHKHSHHYLETLMSTEQMLWANRLRIEFDNISSAWQRAMQAGNGDLVQRAIVPFDGFITQFGLLSDGYTLFQGALDRFGDESKRNEFTAQLLNKQANFARQIHGTSATTAILHRLLPLTCDPVLQVKSHLELAKIYSEIGLWEQADFHFDQAEALTRDADDVSIFIRVVEVRIHDNAIHFRGDFAHGIARLEEMLLLLASSDAAASDKDEIGARLRSALSILAIRHGDYGLAIRYGRQSLSMVDGPLHRQQKGQALLGIALAEQFAGIYAEAIAHNFEALAVEQEIGASEKIGLLKANLCLNFYQIGQGQEALAYGLEAIEDLKFLGATRQEGQARNRVGHTLLMLCRYADAYGVYSEALAVWEPLQHPNRYEAVAGRALAAFHLGKQEEALALVEEVLAFVAGAGLVGIVEPARLLLNCEAVLSGLGQMERAYQTLRQGEAWMQMIAGRISDEAVRHSFLNNRTDNQLLRSRMVAFA